ncbi:MAG: GTP cyclohydrolase II [Deltaproteobacteria bacterium]|nr:GTP cyclohydrolase II [Deltaproteobacteria bacterium]
MKSPVDDTGSEHPGGGVDEIGPGAAAPEGARRRLVERFSEAPLPTGRGPFQVVVFRELATGAEHVAMVCGDVVGAAVPARVHSECLTSEVLGSLKCDCRAQLDRALDFIGGRGRGVLVYLRQEGRGIGLGNKIRAYALQARGHDTYEANRLLGFPDDLRHYDVAADILRQLGVTSVDLITNNPMKIAQLVEAGMPVRRRIALPSPANPHSVDYLRVKRERTGHLIELDAAPSKRRAG